LKAGPRNDLTDVPGVRVGQYQRIGQGWLTGTTVVVPPPGTVGGVDVRGGGPGTRETELLHPMNMVDRVDAVCLSGGSSYGLAAACGVADWVGEHDMGFRVGPEPHHVVPIVPAAVLFDLGAGGRFQNRPTAEFGRRAMASARSRRIIQGVAGAGTGARAGGLKGGVGSASAVLDDGTTVAALAAVNSGGSTVDPTSGELYGARYALAGEFPAARRPIRQELRDHLAIQWKPPSLNTTLVVVATDARLTKGECQRLAISGQDGMTRAINPIHLLTDGDVVFALATGARELPEPPAMGVIQATSVRPRQVNAVLAVAGDVVARAIAHAVWAAKSVAGISCYRERFPSAVSR
jgi:L-aminopeptidase/D-esterase-like protein